MAFPIKKKDPKQAQNPVSQAGKAPMSPPFQLGMVQGQGQKSPLLNAIAGLKKAKPKSKEKK